MVTDQPLKTGNPPHAALNHCMVVHAYYPLSETRVEREAHALIADGHRVDVICLRDDGDLPLERVEQVTVYRLPVRRSQRRGLFVQLFEYLAFFVLVFFKLSTLHREQRYDTIQVHNLPDFLVFATAVAKLRGARIILDLHDLMPEFYASRFNTDLTSWPVRLVIWQEQLSCRFADHVITVSDHWRETLIQRGVPPAKCSVVMNVADERIFQWSDAHLYNGRAHDRFRMIYHGTIVQRYGLDLAVQAVDKVKYRIPGVQLIILGKGDYVDTLIEMVQRLNLGHHVTIYNELRPAQELPDIIRTADLGIVPYRNDTFTDGLLPTKLMEYAALGLPAIAARTSAIASYFEGTMVAFFEPGSADSLAETILALYEAPEQLERLAHGARIFNQRYCWSQIGAQYSSLVTELNSERALAA